ncbi:MAG: DUF2764 family protein [Victivallales bacterium]|nr:DUF2764 family protein [Victivallales bacterium]
MALDLFYFISTLPSLKNTGEGAPRLAEFRSACRGALTERQCAVLENASLCPPATQTTGDEGNAVLREWYSWQTAMRNAIAAFRAKAVKADPKAYQREAEVTNHTGDLRRLAGVLEEKTAWRREQGWEALQWSKLDELEPSMHFCFDALVVYALKLQLLETRRRYSSEIGQAVFEEIIKARLAEAAAHRVQSEG